MRKSIPLTLLAPLAFSSSVLAQDEPLFPQPGERVRITQFCEPTSTSTDRPLPGRCRVAGRLLEVASDRVVLEATGDPRASYELSTLERFEVSLGPRAHRRWGAAVGLIVGVGASYLTFYTGGSTGLCDQSANQDAASSTECVGLLALGGLVGAGLGVLVGGLIRTEGWQDFPVGRLRGGVTTSLSGGLVVAFIVSG